MLQLIDADALEAELRTVTKAAVARHASLADAIASGTAVVLQHVMLRVGAELASLQATNRALSEVLAHVPDRLSGIERRLEATERAR